VFLTYLRRELRRRRRQAIVVAVGLAVGIGLVVTVSSTAAGVKTAQGQVLHGLDGVGTDMTVTKTAAAGSGGPQHFGGFPTGSGGSRRSPSTHFSRDTLRLAFGSATLPSADVSKVAALHGATAAAGGLELTDTSFSGTLPTGGGGFGGARGSAGGGTSTVRPSFDIASFTVDGVQTSSSGVGPLTASQVTAGSYFSSSDGTARVAVVSSSYAKAKSLGVGSRIDVAGRSVEVIGVARLSSGSADVFLPLGTAQALAGLHGDVSTIYVQATDASQVSPLASAVKAAVPGATVSTSASLAKEVTGSLSSASSLATGLGRWLSIAALVVAFLVAGLLMAAAVARRVREFGTLKAIGWRTRRVVGQVMGEGVVVGLAGGVLGIALGVAASEIISAVAPSLTATVPDASTGASGRLPGFGGGGFFRGAASSGHTPGGLGSGAHSVLVHLTAPLQGPTVGLAVGLAVAGGLVAGAFGSWRAARLRPAAALRRVE